MTLFGTDGIRGIANQHPMTSEVALDVGRAVAHIFRGRAGRKSNLVIIGKDTRRSSYMIELALASGLTSQGVNVLLLGPMPTPGVSFLTRSMRADAGIVVSASHNSFEYNGIKIFGHDGFKLSDSIEQEITQMVQSGRARQDLPTGADLGRAKRIDDVMGRYIATVKNHVPNDLSLDGFRVLLDCANGAAYGVAPMVFEELGIEVDVLANKPNGVNINHQCGATHLENLTSHFRKGHYDIGIALDGDADRVIVCDENGEIVDGDAMISILAIDRMERGLLSGQSVVVTPMSNLGLHQCLGNRGIRVLTSDVGDRSVVELMRKENVSLGGEQSGHIVFLDQASTGDGILAALQVLTVMRRSGKKLAELKKVFQRFPQCLENLRVSHKPDLGALKETQGLIKSYERELGELGRVFVRYSGTEPLLRVMIEGQDHRRIHVMAKQLIEVAEREIAQS